MTRPLRNLVAPVISGTPTIGQVLTSTTLGSWSGDLPISFARQWLRNGVPISGATGDSILLSVADFGANITCRITATNALGSVAVESNALGPIAAVLPNNVVAPVVSGTPTEDETLSCTTGSWSGTMPITFSFQWRRDGSPIVGATSTTYVLQAADVGAMVDCVVTATNVGGSTNRDSNDVGPIASSGGVAPTITVAPVLTWTVAHGSSPTITEGTYTGDAGTWTYDLVRLPSTTVLSGVSKATVEAYVADRSTDLGPDWKITGTITNGSGSDAADSNVVTWDRSALPLVGGHSGEGLTLADSGTTVDAWASSFGSISATLTAPTASQRPAYSASGGVGGRPLVTGDAVDNVLVSAAAENFGSTIELGVVGSYSGTANRTMIALDDSTAYLWSSTGPLLRANALTINTASSGSMASPVHASGDAESGGQVRGRIGGSVGASAAIGAGTFNAAIAAFARSAAGTNASAAALQAWYVGAQLTADQRLDLRALLTYLTGVSS